MFFRQVASALELWTVTDPEGASPIAKTRDGRGAVPFWSSFARAQTACESVKAYKGMKPFRLTWEDFVTKWAPHIDLDHSLIGVNYCGMEAYGHDLDPHVLVRRVVSCMKERPEELC